MTDTTDSSVRSDALFACAASAAGAMAEVAQLTVSGDIEPGEIRAVLEQLAAAAMSMCAAVNDLHLLGAGAIDGGFLQVRTDHYANPAAASRAFSDALCDQAGPAALRLGLALSRAEFVLFHTRGARECEAADAPTDFSPMNLWQRIAFG